MYEFGNSFFWISFVLSRRSWCLCTRCRGLCVQRASRRPGSGAPWGILRGWAAPVWSRVFGSINAQPSQQSPDANEMYIIGLHESSAKWESRGKCATKRQLLFKIAAGLLKKNIGLAWPVIESGMLLMSFALQNRKEGNLTCGKIMSTETPILYRQYTTA